MAGRKLASDGKKKRIPPPSWKVDRWRFFTHLARRASICIKLIGSPYWLLRFKNDREQERERKEKGCPAEKRVAKEEGVHPFSTPFLVNVEMEQETSAVWEAVKIFFENKDTVSR